MVFFVNKMPQLTITRKKKINTAIKHFNLPKMHFKAFKSKLVFPIMFWLFVLFVFPLREVGGKFHYLFFETVPNQSDFRFKNLYKFFSESTWKQHE